MNDNFVRESELSIRSDVSSDQYESGRNLESVQKQDEIYVFVRFLGQGSFGKVNLYQNTNDNSLVVWKEIDLRRLDAKMRNEAFAEVEILSILNHANIIGYYKHFIGDDTLYIELEYAKNGTLTNLIEQQKMLDKYFEEETVLWYMYQLTSAVDYIHEMGIMHRDIKTLNIFQMQSGILKLGDFGIAKILDSKQGLAESVVGTPLYMSPELIEGKKYSTKSDIWALGCVFYEILTLTRVFDGTNQLKLAMKIMTSKVNEIEIEEYSDEIKSLVMKILSKDPNERPTAREILSSSILSLKTEQFDTKIDILCMASRKLQRVFTTRIPSSTDLNAFSRQNTNSPVSNFNLQNAIIASKLCEVHLWGGGKLTPKLLELFKNELAAQKVSAGPSHFAVVTVERELFTWAASQGESRFTSAKLGHGKNYGYTRTPKQVKTLSGEVIENVCCGNDFTICLTEAGDLFSFGMNYNGCLGLGEDFDEAEDYLDEEGNAFLPVRIKYFVERGLRVARVACGDAHVIALTESNQVFTWGCGEHGRLGHGDEDERQQPTEIEFSFKYSFKDVFAGTDCSFILTKDGRVLAFGNNEYNKLCLNINQVGFKNMNSQKNIQGFCEIVQQLTPKLIKQLWPYNICKVNSGNNHTSAIDYFGRLFTFGSNRYGQLGVGDFKPRAGLNLIGGALTGQQVTNVACGDTFTICCTSENHVYAWGNRKDGRLGIDWTLFEGNATATPRPIFGTLYQVNDMNARHWHSIIIAEKILNQRSVRSVSYIDALRKEPNVSSTLSSVENLDDAATNQIRFTAFNPPAESSFGNDYNNGSTGQIRPFRFEPNRNENQSERTNEMPTWLKNDVEDAEFIPIEALRPRENEKSVNDSEKMPTWLKNDMKNAEFIPIEALVNKQQEKLGQQEKNQEAPTSLDEALLFIKRLTEENLRLQEENTKLVNKLAIYENKSD